MSNARVSMFCTLYRWKGDEKSYKENVNCKSTTCLNISCTICITIGEAIKAQNKKGCIMKDDKCVQLTKKQTQPIDS